MSCSGFFFFKQKTAYEMRISDWSSDVCSSDLPGRGERLTAEGAGWYLDYAKQRVEPETMRLLLELAEACGVTARRDALFAGAHVNEIGRASCGERVCQDVWNSVVAAFLKKTNTAESYSV